MLHAGDTEHPSVQMQSYQPPTPNTVEQMRGGFLRAMSDAGLKPTVVYHNLTPSELYEKVPTVFSPEFLFYVCVSS